MNDTDLDGKALEALVVDNQDLEELETLLDQFNIFEAVGAVHAEVRHSDFLSFLLDPSKTMGWGTSLSNAYCRELWQPYQSRLCQ